MGLVCLYLLNTAFGGTSYAYSRDHTSHYALNISSTGDDVTSFDSPFVPNVEPEDTLRAHVISILLGDVLAEMREEIIEAEDQQATALTVIIGLAEGDTPEENVTVAGGAAESILDSLDFVNLAGPDKGAAIRRWVERAIALRSTCSALERMTSRETAGLMLRASLERRKAELSQTISETTELGAELQQRAYRWVNDYRRLNSEITITDPDDFSQGCAERVAAELVGLQKLQDHVTLVLATGSTMEGFLHDLADNEEIDWKKVHVFHVDEFEGTSPDQEGSCGYELYEHFFSRGRVRDELPADNIHYLGGINPDLQGYMQTINALGGIDIQILGIGTNGHLGLNEPGSHFDSVIRQVPLTEATLAAQESTYSGIRQTPRGYTMGLGDIMGARHVFLFANTDNKAEIVKDALEEHITNQVPASVLQEHEHLTVVLDSGAVSRLKGAHKGCASSGDLLELAEEAAAAVAHGVRPGQTLVGFGAVVPGELYLLSQAPNAAPKNRMQFPSGAKVLVVETFEGQARVPGRAGVLVDRLAEDNEVRTFCTDGSEDLSGLAERIQEEALAGGDFLPTAIVVPHQASVNPANRLAAEATVRAVSAVARGPHDLISVAYATPSMGNYDLKFYLSGHEADRNDQALAAFVSQMPRTPFDRSARYISRSNALEDPHTEEPQAHDRMQKFVVRRFVNGELQPVELANYGKCHSDTLPEECRDAVVHTISVHNDDSAITSGGLMASMAEHGCIVHNVVTNNSNRTAFPEQMLQNGKYFTFQQGGLNLSSWYENCRENFGLGIDEVRAFMSLQNWTAEKFESTGIRCPEKCSGWEDFTDRFHKYWLAWQTKAKKAETQVSDETLGIADTTFLRLSHDQLQEVIAERPQDAWLTYYDGIAGLPYIGVHGFYNAEGGEKVVSAVEKEVIRESIEQGLEEARRKGKKRFVAVLPLARDPDQWGEAGAQESPTAIKDAHPDHRAMYDAYMEALTALSQVTEDIEIVGVFGAAPWAGVANTYCYYGDPDREKVLDRAPALKEGPFEQECEAAAVAALGNAIPGTELLHGVFGATPPAASEFGGDSAERYNIARLTVGGFPAQDIKAAQALPATLNTCFRKATDLARSAATVMTTADADAVTAGEDELARALIAAAVVLRPAPYDASAPTRGSPEADLSPFGKCAVLVVGPDGYIGRRHLAALPGTLAHCKGEAALLGGLDIKPVSAEVKKLFTDTNPGTGLPPFFSTPREAIDHANKALGIGPSQVIVLVATPDQTHFQNVQEFAALGVNRFIVEKPLADSLAEFDDIIDFTGDGNLKIVSTSQVFTSDVVDTLRGVMASHDFEPVCYLHHWTKDRTERSLAGENMDNAHIFSFEPFHQLGIMEMFDPIVAIEHAYARDMQLPEGEGVFENHGLGVLVARHASGARSASVTGFTAPGKYYSNQKVVNITGKDGSVIVVDIPVDEKTAGSVIYISPDGKVEPHAVAENTITMMSKAQARLLGDCVSDAAQEPDSPTSPEFNKKLVALSEEAIALRDTRRLLVRPIAWICKEMENEDDRLTVIAALTRLRLGLISPEEAGRTVLPLVGATSAGSIETELNRLGLRGMVDRIGMSQDPHEAYRQARSEIMALACSILGIERPEEFKPIRPVRCVIAAAGAGRRLGYDGPKALYPINDKPMITYLLDQMRPYDSGPVAIVSADGRPAIEAALTGAGYGAQYVVQDMSDGAIKGTGEAVLQTQEALMQFDGDIIVNWADNIVRKDETIRDVLLLHQATGAAFTIPTAFQAEPVSNTIRRDRSSGRPVGSVQKLDVDKLPPGEVDIGLFIARALIVFETLNVMKQSGQGLTTGSAGEQELAFPFLMQYMVGEGIEVCAVSCADTPEAIGVNTVAEAEAAAQALAQLPEKAGPGPALKLAKPGDRTTILTGERHGPVNEVLAELLADPKKTGAYAVAVNGQNTGKVGLDEEAAREVQTILVSVPFTAALKRARERAGKDPEFITDDPGANLINVAGLEEGCEAKGVLGLVGHEGHGIAVSGAVGRSGYTDDKRYRQLMEHGTMEEKIGHFVHMVTHLDNPIEDTGFENLQHYEDWIDYLAPSDNVRAFFRRMDAADELIEAGETAEGAILRRLGFSYVITGKGQEVGVLETETGSQEELDAALPDAKERLMQVRAKQENSYDGDPAEMDFDLLLVRGLEAECMKAGAPDAIFREVARMPEVAKYVKDGKRASCVDEARFKLFMRFGTREEKKECIAYLVTRIDNPRGAQEDGQTYEARIKGLMAAEGVDEGVLGIEGARRRFAHLDNLASPEWVGQNFDAVHEKSTAIQKQAAAAGKGRPAYVVVPKEFMPEGNEHMQRFKEETEKRMRERMESKDCVVVTEHDSETLARMLSRGYIMIDGKRVNVTSDNCIAYMDDVVSRKRAVEITRHVRILPLVNAGPDQFIQLEGLANLALGFLTIRSHDDAEQINNVRELWNLVMAVDFDETIGEQELYWFLERPEDFVFSLAQKLLIMLPEMQQFDFETLDDLYDRAAQYLATQA